MVMTIWSHLKDIRFNPDWPMLKPKKQHANSQAYLNKSELKVPEVQHVTSVEYQATYHGFHLEPSHVEKNHNDTLKRDTTHTCITIVDAKAQSFHSNLPAPIGGT